MSEKHWQGGLLLATACLLCYLPVFLSGQWNFSWDDRENYVANSRLTLSASNVAWHWTHGVVVDVWEPMSLCLKSLLLAVLRGAGWDTDCVGGDKKTQEMVMSDSARGEGSDTARAMHVFGAGLHLVVCLLVWRFTLRCLRLISRLFPSLECRHNGTAALCACVLFAVHPLHAHVLGWLSCLPYLFSAVFGMCCVLCHMEARERPPGHKTTLAVQGAALLFLMLSFLSKASGVSVPLALAALECFACLFSQPHGKRVVPKQVLSTVLLRCGYLLLPCVCLIAAAVTNENSNSAVDRLVMTDLGVPGKLAKAAVAMTHYTRSAVWPVEFSPLYPLPPDGLHVSLSLVLSCVAVVGCGACCVAVWLSRVHVHWTRGRAYPSLLSVLLGLSVPMAVALVLPTLGFVGHGYSIMHAERYAYLPSVVMVPFVALCVVRVARWLTPATEGGMRTTAMVSLCVPLAVLLAARTQQQVQVWRHARSVWQHAARHPACANDFFTHHNLALTYDHAGELDQATRAMRHAIEARPHLVGFWVLSGMYMRQEDWPSMLSVLEQGVSLATNLEKGDREELLAHATHDVLATLYNDYATALTQPLVVGGKEHVDWAAAAEYFQRSLKAIGRGARERKRGQKSRNAERNKRTDDSGVDHGFLQYQARVQHNAGTALFQSGSYKEALTHFRRSLTWYKDQAHVLNMLAACHQRLHDTNRAHEKWTQCVALRTGVRASEEAQEECRRNLENANSSGDHDE